MNLVPAERYPPFYSQTFFLMNHPPKKSQNNNFCFAFIAEILGRSRAHRRAHLSPLLHARHPVHRRLSLSRPAEAAAAPSDSGKVQRSRLLQAGQPAAGRRDQGGRRVR